ncbi:TPM domain-containing protein [Niabella sp. CJ426]|uniref:TPM domain-containing protein n=1 Tax=Niabella sp. CJ426 TaxID=3393740 RepID=UPI003D07E64F
MTALFQQFRTIRHASLKCGIFSNKWYLLAGFIICLSSACNSSGKVNNTAAKRKTETKVILPAQQVATPAGINYVYDYENIFTPGEEKKLDSLARVFEKSNLIPIRITTVNDPAVTAENFDQGNKILLDEWSGIHGKSDRCMSVSISKQLRRIRIDYGPFVSRLLSDDEAKAIVENQFKPSFKQDQFFQGSWNGLNALMDTIRKNIKF